jgi:UDP-N-acetylmuramate--alanine ligase
MPFYGTAILCTDDPAVRDIVPQVSCPITSYGFSRTRRCAPSTCGPWGRRCTSRCSGATASRLPDLEVVLNLAGEHNVLNALSAIAVAVELNVPDAAVQKALAEFKGVGRRFQSYGELPAKDGGAVHRDRRLRPPPGGNGRPRWPRRAALSRAGAWCWPSSRTATPARATASRISSRSSGSADAVLLTEVYAAGEAPIVAADGRSLARALRVAGKVEPVFVDDMAAMPQAIDNARDGDVVMCMGAGSIGAVPAKLVDLLMMGGAQWITMDSKFNSARWPC